MQNPTRRNRDPDAGRSGNGHHDRRDQAPEREPREDARPNGAERRPRRLSGAAAVEYAKAQLLDLTGQPCESVSSLSRTRDGWRVALEVVELERIPRTTDILASYVVELDDEGELMGYERVHRYYRNEVSGEQ
jgi:hypothetical protein